MEEKNAKKKTNVFITVLIIVAIVALVLVKYSIDNLANVISNYQANNNNNNNNEQNYYDDDTNWEDRIDELEQTIKKQSQSIDTLKIKFKNCNAKNKTVEIHFAVTPKEYTADTKAEVAFGKYSRKLKQKKGKFIGSVTVPYEQVFTLFHFTFETNGVTKSSTINADEYSDYEDFSNWDTILQENVTCEDNYESNEDILDGKATLEIENLDLTVNESEVSGYTPQICFSKDGKVVYSQDMKYNAEDNQYYGSAKTTVDCNNNDTYKCFVRYIGKSGLEYRYYCNTYECEGEDNYVDSTISDAACIYGTDGKELQFNYVDDDNEE